MQNIIPKITRKMFFIVTLLSYLSAFWYECSADHFYQPIKKIFLKKEGERYFFCVDFLDGIKFTPRVHTLSNGVKLILSFNRLIRKPNIKPIKNHSIVNGVFFELIGNSSLMMVLSLKNNVTFSGKSYTSNSVKIGFNAIKKKVIVIDAGHGGKDPGTKGITGDLEKNIALVMAIELRNRLLNSGRYKVYLIRDKDQFVSIDDRKKLVNLYKADMLISLHTDSNNDEKIRGISVYTLPNIDSITKMADRANFGNDTENYYKILALSRNFANILIGYIPNVCKIRNRPCRNTELKILKSHIPAVLIELGCVSNKTDDHLLHSMDFRDKTCNAILYALDKFFKGIKDK
jgi:N-acetylmuramoyl-L-alanine amidase